MNRKRKDLVSRKNYHATRDYLQYRDEVFGLKRGSIALYRTALDHFLRWSTSTPISRAPDLRPVFPRYLVYLGTMSLDYQKKMLAIYKDFLEWGKDRHPTTYPGKIYRDTLRAFGDEDFKAEMQICTLNEMLALASSPVHTLTEQRDRAAACFLFLSGIRARAFVTLPLRAFNIDRYEIKQLTELGVETKNNKSAITYFLRNEDIKPLVDVVREWDEVVNRHLGPTAPWYALIDHHRRFAEYQVPGKSRTSNLARHLESLCERVGLEYRSPHKFRHGFAVYGLKLCRTMEDYKAISLDLMHDDILTTDKVYARMMQRQVSEVIAELGNKHQKLDDAEMDALADHLFERLEKKRER